MKPLSLVHALGCLLAVLFPVHAAVPGFKVTTDRTIDASSLESIVAQVTARAGARSNDEQAIAIYEYLHHSIFHYAYPEEKAQSVGPLKVLNVYGWGLCGGQHTVLKALFETAGWECRYVGWSNPGHTTIEVKYDGRWHYFDVFLKCYFWSKDRSHVVSQEEIAADPSLVLAAVKEGRAARAHLCCGDEEKGVISGVRSRKIAGDQKGWASVTWRDENYSPLLRLPSGASLRLGWGMETNGFAVNLARQPLHTCQMKDLRNDPVLGPLAEHYGPRSWSNGRLLYAPGFAKAADVADIELTAARAEGNQLIATGPRGAAIFKLPLPYVYVSATPFASFTGGVGKLSLSTDGGKTWSVCRAGITTDAVKQRYEVWFKGEFAGALTEFRVEALVEHNRGVLPYLANGRNTITVATGDESLPKGASVTVTYAYQEASVPNPEKRKRWDGTGITYGPVKTVTKEISALPFQFDVEVGGNLPPRMLSLERAVVGRQSIGSGGGGKGGD